MGDCGKKYAGNVETRGDTTGSEGPHFDVVRHVAVSFNVRANA